MGGTHRLHREFFWGGLVALKAGGRGAARHKHYEGTGRNSGGGWKMASPKALGYGGKAKRTLSPGLNSAHGLFLCLFFFYGEHTALPAKKKRN